MVTEEDTRFDAYFTLPEYPSSFLIVEKFRCRRRSHAGTEPLFVHFPWNWKPYHPEMFYTFTVSFEIYHFKAK